MTPRPRRLRRLRRRLLLATLTLTGVWLLLMISPSRTPNPVPQPLVAVALINPFELPPLEDYGAVRALVEAHDAAGLRALQGELDGFLAYRVAWALAQHEALSAAERLEQFERVLELRLDDPLERDARRDLQLRLGLTAEAAGAHARALEAFTLALPHPEAIDAIERLPISAIERARAFAAGRQHSRVLSALAGAPAPSLEAPALRALGRHAEALAAYERWRAAEPQSREALEGIAWSLFSLERFEAADTAFAELGGANGLYGRGLVAGRQGRIDDGVAWLVQTQQAARMWIASGWLEQRDRPHDAIDLYLQIAATGDRTYADDAAYRALVLAERVGDAEAAARAAGALPPGSFFDLLRGGALALPSGAPAQALDLLQLNEATQQAVALAQALWRAGDAEAARGEALFALREQVNRGDTLEAIALAQWLQQHGEYRQSTRFAQGLLAAERGDLRLWELVYPRAHREAVERSAAEFGVEPAWVWAIMKQESAFAPFAVSTSNAQGLMQVIPSTWTWLAELLREPVGDPFDPVTNIRYGTYYLGWLERYFDGDLELATASYNRGQGYIGRLFAGDQVQGDKDELYRFIDALETREYLQIVSVNLAVYRALYR